MSNLHFGISEKHQNWIIYGLFIIGVLITLLIIYRLTRKNEGYILGFSDEEKCNKNSRKALTQHCNQLLNEQQLPMLKFNNKDEKEKFKKDFMLGCDNMRTLKELCSRPASRNLLKQIVENSKILLDESKKFKREATQLKEKLKRENESSVLNPVFKVFGL